MIVATPLNLPKLQPDDWGKWWDVWREQAKPLTKKRQSPNSQSGLHVGFDIYRHKLFTPTYEAVFCDLESLYPSLYEQAINLDAKLYGVRFVMSHGDFPAHMDNAWPSWSIRSLFHCEDPNPQWYYTRKDGTDKRWLTLPDETNWFSYLDGVIKHGTHYNEAHPKIILQVFCHATYSQAITEKSFGAYPAHTIEYD